MADQNAALPVPTTPIVGPNGIVTIPWWYFFQRLFARTGGGTGGDFGPGQRLNLTGSPFAFSPGQNGTLFVSAGGIYQMTISRAGGTAFPVGVFYGAFPMASSDMITVHFVGTPELVFYPG